MRILIANRGEIARRIIRTAHRLGHQTVAAYADPDRDAPFVEEATTAVRLGPADLALSYLSIEALLEAAARTGADAVHPGYGFLAESAALARAVLAAGHTWIGPSPEAVATMGSKIEARRLAAAAGVPTIPGYDASQEPAALAAAAADIGFPVLVKASAGGGGKGIRIARAPEEFATALREASEEAERAFGDDAVIVERFVQRPRHVEVQVVGDRHGTVLHLGTRECSVQRRYQKVIEEAPAPNLPAATRAALRADATRLAASIRYDSAGTVEFIVDDETGEHFFLEMNTRLQVEHPVTELVTGLDLVELQLLAAEGRPLPLTQDQVVLTGHAFEARINAEDPWAGFVPQTGTVAILDVPDGVRWDSAIEAGSVVTTHYDPMVAKLVAGGRDRETARQRLVGALEALMLAGLPTNAGLLHWVLRQRPVVEGRVTTRFLDEVELPERPALEAVAAVAARAWRDQRDAHPRGDGVWSRSGRLRLTPHRPTRTVTVTSGDEAWEIGVGPDAEPLPTAVALPGAVAVDLGQRIVAVTVAGATHTFGVPTRQQRWSRTAAQADADADALVSPFPATVAEVSAAAGERVAQGQVLVVVEAMKMLHSVRAPGAGTVAEVRVAVGDQVDSEDVLVTFAAPDDDDATDLREDDEP